MSLFQPSGVHKEPGLGQIHQPHLCWHLDNTSPRIAFTSTSTAASECFLPRPAELVPVSPCSCPPRGPQRFHSQVSLASQELACQGTLDFHLQVNTLKNVLANALLTFTHKSLHCCHRPIRDRLATVARFPFCGAVILLL